ncbi:MAG: FAD-dependent oxidoreductase [Planctomycetota bacterium]
MCALITRNVDGPLPAGRGISGAFITHSSYRVTGSAAATGQAAGVAAALATDRNCLPHQIPWERKKATVATFDSALS